MESSPLILAHDHARAASVATQSSDTTVAINEHALAAGEFARAASGTGSAEALRTLRLLETHHQRLSELLRYPAEYPPSTTSAEQEVKEVAEKPLSTSAAVAELRASKSDLGPRASSPLRTPPGLQHPRRLPPRDLSSSIASNLASARGIRANYARQPLSPSVSTQQAPGSLEALPRRDGKRSQVPASIPEHPQRSWVPPTQGSGAKIPSPTSSRKASIAESTASDEGFSRFYNIFENALSKLSAPLAFAGLPMMSDVGPPALTPEPSANPRYQQSKGRDRTGSDPDLTKYISRAALRASARDGYSANDSFYVVPTTGHTVSYAHILSFEQKEKQRMAASLHSQNSELCEEEDFVDASETLMPASPNFSRKSSTRKMTGKQLETRFEELDMENKSLKEVIDKMSKRLVSFEMAAQNNTMALQESMRLARNMSPARESSGQEDESLKLRLSDLEESSRLTVKELDKQIKENEKLRNVIARYRERWEKLKEGAKSRATARDGGVLKDHGKDTAKDVNGSGDPDLAPGRLLKA